MRKWREIADGCKSRDSHVFFSRSMCRMAFSDCVVCVVRSHYEGTCKLSKIGRISYIWLYTIFHVYVFIMHIWTHTRRDRHIHTHKHTHTHTHTHARTKRLLSGQWLVSACTSMLEYRHAKKRQRIHKHKNIHKHRFRNSHPLAMSTFHNFTVPSRLQLAIFSESQETATHETSFVCPRSFWENDATMVPLFFMHVCLSVCKYTFITCICFF